MFATQVLPETSSDDLEEESNTLVGFIVIDNEKHEVKKGETKIGRDSSMCSIVIENFTVSKVHAIIESDGIDDSFIYDVGSTNQTRLGKKILKPHCRYKLDNGSNITLGNVLVKFIFPPDTDSAVTPAKSNQDNHNVLDEYGDIFDVATQMVTPQYKTSSSVTAIENNKKYIQTFKIPDPKPNRSYEQSIFDCETQFRLTSKETDSKTEENDSSGIFSLATQFQIYKSPVVTENKNENKSVQEGDELQSFLNDGQDDMLCAVVSLHSPKEPGDGTVKRSKTEIGNLSQVLDAPTQVQTDVTEPQEEKGAGSLQENDLTSPCLPVGASTPFNNKLNCVQLCSNVSENNSCTQEDEDFIKTQEFRISEPNKDCQPDSLSQDETTQAYLVETLADNSTVEQKNDDEDFILTQNFEAPARDQLNKSPAIVIPETQDFDEDIIETQVFDTEKEKKQTEDVTKMGPPQSPDAIVACSQRNSEDDFEETQLFEEPTTRDVGNFEKRPPKSPETIVDCSQINKDDFEETQLFEEPTISTTSVGNFERNVPSDDEDFIATQVVELPKNTTTNSQEARIDEASRESSPDLLALGNRDSEDCVSTQTFEPDFAASSVFSEKFLKKYLSVSEKCSDNVKAKAPEAVAESSGDETESDLEILLDKNETIRKDVTSRESCSKIKSESFENHERVRSPASQVSNDSYVFELQPGNNAEEKQVVDLTDSDATDCEEIALLSSKITVKREAPKPVEFEETQVLTLTPPDNFVEKTSNTCLADSPEFEIGRDRDLEEGAWSPLSLEMPSTQDMEASLKRKCEGTALEKHEEFGTPSSKVQKIEVGIDTNGCSSFWKIEPSEKNVHSPKKRPLDCNDVQVVEVKKSKTEDRLSKSSKNPFSRLLQDLDISGIRPNRTRNSMEKAETSSCFPAENGANTKRPNSRRKSNAKGNGKILNCDITPYLIKKGRRSSRGEQKKEATPNEKGSNTVSKVEGSTRVLRSSMRISTSPNNSLKPLERTSSRRKSKRNSVTKKSEYFENASVSVAFTGFESASFDAMVSDLGGKKVNDLTWCEVVVADKVRRTVKLLCAIGLSLPITSTEWLVSCKKENKFLNPWNFILKDKEAEYKWDFELKTSLERSKREKLFDGFSIFATKSTKPPVKDLLAIVECCGGTPIFEPPAVWPKKTIIVSCLEDKKYWPAPKLRNVRVVHYEFILSGVLRQKLDFKTHKLR